MAKKNVFSLVNILLYVGLFIVMYYIIKCINSKYNLLEGFDKKVSGGEIAGITIGALIVFVLLFIFYIYHIVKYLMSGIVIPIKARR